MATVTGSDRAAAKVAIAEAVAKCAESRLQSGLRAVVLTGSLARNEATFVRAASGLRLLGDVDVFLVYRDDARLPADHESKAAAGEIAAVLRDKGIVAEVSLGTVNTAYLRKGRRNIATYELRSSGEVIWGERAILSLVPAFDAALLSKEDAWRLLANRIVEQFETIASADDVRSEPCRYRTVKLYLDMATSYLVFAGRYAGTYAARARALSELAASAEATQPPFPLGPFADVARACTRCKLEGSGLEADPFEVWSGAVAYAERLWRWELMQLTGGSASLADAELMSRWMARQPAAARLYGWASAARRSDWRWVVDEWPHWLRLAPYASPRYWVYSVAAPLLFRLPALLKPAIAPAPAADWNELRERLPLRRPPRAERDASTWSEVAQTVTWNYRRLLEGANA